MKTALITGITGQDGSYLSELLLSKGYNVHGIMRRSSSFNTKRIDHLINDPEINNRTLFLHYGDMTDSSSIRNAIKASCPDEIYNLAAQSHVGASFRLPEFTMDSNGLGPLRILEAIRGGNLEKHTRFYQASSSELFGKVREIPQNEMTPFHPRSPYGTSKACAYWTTVNYREAYGIHTCNGILFNHESPRRGETFATRKITRAVGRIATGTQDRLVLGNLDSKRDWGYSAEYVEAMWRMLQQDEPGDYVIATGVTTTLRDFARMAFSHAGIELEFSGEGVNEQGVDNGGRVLVEVSPEYFRPAEVDLLIGDASKAKAVLGWKPQTDVNELCRLMVEHDTTLAATETRA